MKRRTVNFWVVIALTLVAAVLVAAANRVEPLENKKFFQFPLTIGDWRGREIPMSDYVYRGIETPYLFLRDYTSPRYPGPVNLSIVWFDDTNIAFHAPEACLGGVSDTVRSEGKVRIRLDKEYEINRFITNLGGTDYLVIYFFDVDGYITTSQTALRLRVLQKRLLFKRASTSFIRIMAPVGTDEEKTLESLKSFLREIYPLIPDYTYTDKVHLGV